MEPWFLVGTKRYCQKHGTSVAMFCNGIIYAASVDVDERRGPAGGTLATGLGCRVFQWHIGPAPAPRWGYGGGRLRGTGVVSRCAS